LCQNIRTFNCRNRFRDFFGMRMVLLFPVLVMVFAFRAGAVNDNHPAGGRSAGLAHASVMLADFWCFHHNQGGLPYVRNLMVGFHHHSGFVREMAHQSLALIVPTSSGSLAGSFSYYGFSHYHQTKAAVAYGLHLSGRLTAGIQLDYFHTRIAGIYGRQRLFTFEAGVQYRVNEKWQLGAHLFNPVRQKAGLYEEAAPCILRLGAAWRFSENLLFCLEAEKDLEQQVMPKMAIEYELVPLLFLRTGIALEPVLNSFGVGYCWQELQADLAFSFHPSLGQVSNFSLTYAF